MSSCSFSFGGKTYEGYDDPEEAVRLLELKIIAVNSVFEDRLHVLEWGSGLSTFVLAEEVARHKDGRLTTIDHTADWQKAVMDALPEESRKRTKAIVADLDGQLVPDVQDVTYSTVPLDLICKDINRPSFDLIVIDGRRRIECAFVASLISRPHTIIALHDYRRLRYQHVTLLLDKVSDGLHYRVMKQNPDSVKLKWSAWASYAPKDGSD